MTVKCGSEEVELRVETIAEPALVEFRLAKILAAVPSASLQLDASCVELLCLSDPNQLAAAAASARRLLSSALISASLARFSR